MRILRALILALALLATPLLGALPGASAADAAVRVDPASASGTLATINSTNLVYPNVVEDIGAQGALDRLAPPLLRIHAGTDGTWDGGPAPALPAGLKKGDWDFSSMDMLVHNARSYGGRPLMNIRYAPNWMWTCTAYWTDSAQGVGRVRDASFREFADYVARLVAYYNTGSMTAEDGRVIANPAGTANRIDYWELWNEPDLSNETPCHPSDWGVALTPAQYLAMWNAVAPAMRAVDPTIRLVGPATANASTGQSPEYVPTLVGGATIQPDAVSFHGYGGWENSQPDKQIFDGGSQTDGLQGIVDGLAQVRAWAPGKPVWVTEINVNADWGNDPKGRPWGPYGVAWDASAFLRLAKGGAGFLHWYQFSEGAQFAMIDASTGKVYLPYWTMTALSRAFPTGSQVLGATSSLAGVETMAVRRPDGTLGVLVVNRQVNSATVVGGAGLAGTVAVDLGLDPAAVRLTQIDAATSAATGPVARDLPASRSVSLSFPGYGIAILDVTTGGTPPPSPSPVPTPSPSPVPTPSPSPIPTPTPTPRPSPSPSALPSPSPSPVPSPSPSARPSPSPAPGAILAEDFSGDLGGYKTQVSSGNSLGIVAGALEAVKVRGKGGNANIAATFPAQASLGVALRFRLESPARWGEVPIVGLYAQGQFVGWVSYYVDPDSPVLYVYNAATDTRYACGAPTLDAWHTLELRYTASAFALVVDGVGVCGKSGIRAIPAGPGLNKVVLGPALADASAGLTVRIDDVTVAP